MKVLKKVRLINWHRFPDETIEFADSVLLSGENGAGKSTILDAIQFVITCSKAHFNKAAHEKGKRNLNTYIRCKTGREDRPYDRTGEISAHIALEFYDEAKKRPFIVGAVMDSASEEKEPNTAWYLIENRELKDDFFKKGNSIKSISAFRASNKEIHTFAGTIKEAQKMMLSRFGRIEDKFFSLIPKALGIEGPVISASRIAVLKPFLWVDTAKSEVTRDLPTPPLPLTTPITFLIFESSWGCSCKLSGSFRDEQF